jgi:hypothetical protein
MINLVTKAYVLKNFAKDAVDFVKDRVSDIEWDRESLLHRAGLASYRPGRAAFGTVGLFALGIVVGGFLGMAFAPRPGSELRGQLRDRARKMMEGERVPSGGIHSGATAGYDQPRS